MVSLLRILVLDILVVEAFATEPHPIDIIEELLHAALKDKVKQPNGRSRMSETLVFPENSLSPIDAEILDGTALSDVTPNDSLRDQAAKLILDKFQNIAIPTYLSTGEAQDFTNAGSSVGLTVWIVPSRLQDADQIIRQLHQLDEVA